LPRRALLRRIAHVRLHHVVAVGQRLAHHHVVDVAATLEQFDLTDGGHLPLERRGGITATTAAAGRGAHHALETEGQLALLFHLLVRVLLLLRTAGDAGGRQTRLVQVLVHLRRADRIAVLRLIRNLVRD